MKTVLSYRPRLWEGLEDAQLVPVALNLCIWHDGTLRPARGHIGNCKWNYDGQVFYHLTAQVMKG